MPSIPRSSDAYVFVNERGQPFAGWASLASLSGLAKRQTFRFRFSAHAPPCLRLRTGEQGDGYAEASALPRPCLNHKHCSLFRDEPGAV